MVRPVTISCLTDRPLAVPDDLSPGAAVDAMIAHWRSRLDTVVVDRPDIIVLPEYCDRPANYDLAQQAEYFAARGESIVEFFAEVAQRSKCHIAYSAVRKAEDGSQRNSTQILDPTGSVVGVYDKNHLVVEEYTERGTRYGTEIPVFDLEFGRVACVICFDLNFDELREAYAVQKPDLILFSSAYHGGLMQSYWAYSCRAYFASSVYPPAPSGIISPVGEELFTTTNYHNHVTGTVNLDRVVIHLDYNRAKFGDIKRKYGPQVRIHDPGLLGSVLLTSETDEFTALDVVSEFDLELLDDYFTRVRKHRADHLE